MDFHFATAWEQVADQFPDRTAAICDGKALSWRDYEHRAARIAGLLESYGLGADSKAGLYLHNCNQYSEAQFGIFKIGGCPINVNYRYKADELVYLLDNADVEAIVFQGCYAMRIWEIKDRLPKVKAFIQVDDGTEALLDFAVDYERAIRDSAPAERIERDPEGIYMLYTGGTTGMPKGVMYPVGGFATLLTGMGAASRELPPPADMSVKWHCTKGWKAPGDFGSCAMDWSMSFAKEPASGATRSPGKASSCGSSSSEPRSLYIPTSIFSR